MMRLRWLACLAALIASSLVHGGDSRDTLLASMPSILDRQLLLEYRKTHTANILLIDTGNGTDLSSATTDDEIIACVFGSSPATCTATRFPNDTAHGFDCTNGVKTTSVRILNMFRPSQSECIDTTSTSSSATAIMTQACNETFQRLWPEIVYRLHGFVNWRSPIAEVPMALRLFTSWKYMRDSLTTNDAQRANIVLVPNKNHPVVQHLTRFAAEGRLPHIDLAYMDAMNDATMTKTTKMSATGADGTPLTVSISVVQPVVTLMELAELSHNRVTRRNIRSLRRVFLFCDHPDKVKCLQDVREGDLSDQRFNIRDIPFRAVERCVKRIDPSVANSKLSAFHAYFGAYGIASYEASRVFVPLDGETVLAGNATASAAAASATIKHYMDVANRLAVCAYEFGIETAFLGAGDGAELPHVPYLRSLTSPCKFMADVLTCPVTQMPLQFPCMNTKTGRTYECSALHRSVAANHTDPLDSTQPTELVDIVFNRALFEVIQRC